MEPLLLSPFCFVFVFFCLFLFFYRFPVSGLRIPSEHLLEAGLVVIKLQLFSGGEARENVAVGLFSACDVNLRAQNEDHTSLGRFGEVDTVAHTCVLPGWTDKAAPTG